MCSMRLDSWHTSKAELSIPAKRYRIGELVRYSPFSRQTIHNYTIMGLIREAEWTAGGHRLYDESVFSQLARIVDLRRTKSLAEIRRILREEDQALRPSTDTAATGAESRDEGVPAPGRPDENAGGEM